VLKIEFESLVFIIVLLTNRLLHRSLPASKSW